MRRVRADRRVLLFGKLPLPGRAKTRLATRLGAEGAATLYAAFLEDTAAAVRSVNGAEAELWLEPPPASRSDEAARRLADRLRLPLRWQRGSGLGERLESAFRRGFAEGAAMVVAVGSDHPTLPPARIEAAFEALRTAEVALGPSKDGGYYLIGLARPSWPAAEALFREVPWSTSRVLAETRARIGGLGLRAAELAGWYDVDEPADLERLRVDLRPGSRTARALARLESSEPGRPDAGRPG